MSIINQDWSMVMQNTTKGRIRDDITVMARQQDIKQMGVVPRNCDYKWKRLVVGHETAVKDGRRDERLERRHAGDSNDHKFQTVA